MTRAVQEQTARFGEVSCGYFLEHELVSRDVPVSRGYPCIPFSQDREINQLFCTAFASALVDRGNNSWHNTDSTNHHVIMNT